jgi:16S rRNA (cytosine967-C5)-methyltransferase
MAAARVLLALEARRGTLAAEVDRARRGILDERDRALLFELVSGVSRWRAELDARLLPCVTRPMAELAPDILAVLRMGAYQLTHLDRIPPHAVVHQSVELMRELGQPRAAGLVNAVLRTLQRRAGKPDVPMRPPDPSDVHAWTRYLTTSLSHPAWLVERWIARHGVEATERWCVFNNEPPAVTARAMDPHEAESLARAFAEAEIVAEPARFVRAAWRFPSGGLGRVPAAVRDRLVVQDETSQIVAHLVDARPDQTVLDVCAAPGGKSVLLADDMARRGVLVSCDSRPRRLALLRAAVARAALPVRVVRLDASRALPFGPVFDRVLVDAPCSGLGTLARDPDIKWTREAADLARLADQQQRMLSASAGVVRPGGRLIYATCSGEPEENEAIVNAFLRTHAEFARAPRPAPSAADALVTLDTLLNAEGDLQTWPFVHGLDAFFAAVLVRREGT